MRSRTLDDGPFPRSPERLAQRAEVTSKSAGMEFPRPQVGLVISYSYLWREEAETGQVEGRKDRPCAIVLVVRESEDKPPVVTVVPITHSPPQSLETAVEIPAAVKRHLGLDEQPSWVMLDDFNVFTWPGYDLRPVPGQKDRYHYGLLPPRLFESIVRKFSDLRRQGQVAHTRVTMKLCGSSHAGQLPPHLRVC